jgi:hypothetical protein
MNGETIVTFDVPRSSLTVQRFPAGGLFQQPAGMRG